MSPAEGQQIFQEYQTFTQDLTKSGKNKGGAPLEQSTTATTVRVRNGKTVVTDGPFAETKEQLGGYYLVQARDIDQAISLAARLPGAKFAAIERPPSLKTDIQHGAPPPPPPRRRPSTPLLT